MKKIVLALVMVAGFVSADEYGYFSRINDDYSTEWQPVGVTLHAGDTFTLLSFMGYPEISIDIGDGSPKTLNISSMVLKIDSPNANYGFAFPAEQRTIVGPGVVSVTGISGGTYVAYKIVRATDNSISPANVISLPADVNGDMQLVFESSNDLLNWTQVYSFTHNSSSQSSKFFRTRLIQN